MTTYGNHFLDGLSPAELDLVRPYLTEADLPRGESVGAPLLSVEHVWFPVTTVLSVVTTMRSGQQVEACTIGHESAYGLLNALSSGPALDRVVAQVPGRAWRMPAVRLRGAAALNVGLTEAVVRHAQANAAQAHQSVACNALHDVEARLCRWLLMTQDRVGAPRLPLTQEFLSFMLGVQRTTVTGVARSLQAEGLIRYSRGKIDILDRAGLMAGACECYQALREKYVQALGGSFADPLRAAERRS